ncbi:MAG: hypothetical protein V2B19_16385 [Pseudomonadota bacterium]
MELLYTVAEVPIFKIKTVRKDFTSRSPACQATRQKIYETGAYLPIIISKNFWLLNGHKTLAVLRGKQETVTVIVFNKDMTFTSAKEMYETLNHRFYVLPQNYDEHNTISVSDQIKDSRRGAQKLLSTPIKAHYGTKLLLLSLEIAPEDIRTSIVDALSHATKE